MKDKDLKDKNINKNLDEKIKVENEDEKYADVEILDYKENYSESSFWDKIKKIGKKMGLRPLCYALALYYVLQKKDVPLKDKGIIIGGLGYWILPLDIVPDFIPMAGYADDAAIMFIAVKKVAKYIDSEVKLNVYIKVNEWLKNIEYAQVEKILGVHEK